MGAILRPAGATLLLATTLLASAAGAGAQQLPESEGVVRKVDHHKGKVTLVHGPVKNLDMPAMTMTFTATDPKLLRGLKKGDKVRFTADRKGGSYLVTDIRPRN